MKKGKLKIYFGYFYETAKTRTMIEEIIEKYQNKEKVIIADVLINDIEINEKLQKLPHIVYGMDGVIDIDSIIRMKATTVVLDRLEDNSKQSRNKYRYEDVIELLNNGINVYTTLNVFNIESLKEYVKTTIYDFKNISTIPDYIFLNADSLEFVDIPVNELMNRLSNNFYLKEISEMQLTSLRSLALGKVLDHANYSKPGLKNLSNLNFLVCISGSPSSIKSIEWTARTAGAFYAPWKALYIMNGKYDENLDNNETLKANFKLVKELGGEIIQINASNIDLAIIEYAYLTNVTNIVIGKSRTKRFLVNKTSLEDKIINQLKNVDIHIIPDSVNNQVQYKDKQKTIKPKFKYSTSDLLKTVITLLLATILSLIINKLYPEFNETLIYLLAVVVISEITTGYYYGLITSLLSVFLYLFLFTEPSFTLSVVNIDSIVTFVIMFIVSIATSVIALNSKVEKKNNIKTIIETEKLYTLNQELIKLTSKNDLIKLIQSFFENEFNTKVYLIEENNQNENEIIKWVFDNHKKAGYKKEKFGESRYLYLPLLSNEKILGVLEVINPEMIKENDSFINLFLTQFALVLEKQDLIDHKQILSELATKENVRSNLLRAISHDLRTPLTSIYGFINTIIEEENLTKQEINEILENGRDDILWLIRMVENLLSITRINQETKKVTKKDEVVEEVLSEAVLRFKKRFSNFKISIKIPKEMLIIPMEGTLIEQVIINLFENVIKHGKNVKRIELSAEDDFDKVIFKVSDDGKNIDLTKIESILSENKILEYSDSRSHSSGIGLLICKTIIQAHEGQFSFYKNNDGGLTFYFTLPKEASK